MQENRDYNHKNKYIYMQTTFTKPDASRGRLQLTIVADDYSAEQEKILKNIKKKANIPGFRPGNAPMALIKRQYGPQAKAEAIEKTIEEAVAAYLKDNNVPVLGRAMVSPDSKQLDIEGADVHEVSFDVALRPEISFSLSADDKLTFCKVVATDEDIDKQVEAVKSSHGQMLHGVDFLPDTNDMIRANLSELAADGSPKADGIATTDSSLMPQYFGSDEQKALFLGAKVGSRIVFCPAKACPGGEAEIAGMLKLKKEEAAGITACFEAEITDISRYQPAELGPELFEKLQEEMGCANEQQLRDKLKTDLESAFHERELFLFLKQVRSYAEEKVGEVPFADDLLAKMYDIKDAKIAQRDGYKGSLADQFRWQTLSSLLTTQTGIKVEEADVLRLMRLDIRDRFMKYGMSYADEATIDSYARKLYNDMEQRYYFVNLAEELKLAEAIKQIVSIEEKTISPDEFEKLEGE